MEEFKKIAQSYYTDLDTRNYPKGVFDETCMGAVPLSFNLIAQSKSFENAIRLAISHGGDSDTIGAIVGSIAEARLGIPQEIRIKVINYLPKDMKRYTNPLPKKKKYTLSNTQKSCTKFRAALFVFLIQLFCK